MKLAIYRRSIKQVNSRRIAEGVIRSSEGMHRRQEQETHLIIQIEDAAEGIRSTTVKEVEPGDLVEVRDFTYYQHTNSCRPTGSKIQRLQNGILKGKRSFLDFTPITGG